MNFKPFLISVIANSLETVTGRKCDVTTVAFSPNAANPSSLADLTARWLPIVELFLPLLTATVKPDEFFQNLSKDESYISNIKLQMDAMLAATGASENHKAFADLVSVG